MLELLLIRHGESAWNATGRYQGHADIGLSATGFTQARALGRRLSVHPFDAMYCSDLRRARETAEIIARQATAPPIVREDCRWRELHVGSLSGLTLEEAKTLGVYRRLEFDTDRHPGGESKLELRQRVSAALDHVTSRHPKGRIAVVAHGGSIKAAVDIILGTTGCSCNSLAGFAAVGNTAVSRFVFDNSASRRLVTFNDLSHLEASAK